MEKNSKKQSVKLVIENLNGEICAQVDRGTKWKFPKNVSHRVILSALVSEALLNEMESVSSYADNYQISIETKVLDE